MVYQYLSLVLEQKILFDVTHNALEKEQIVGVQA